MEYKWWLLLAVGAVASILTFIVWRYARVRQVLDIPNERSAHTTPTPRGGGVAIVLAFLGAASLLAVQHIVDVAVVQALVGAGGLVAAIGFLDDHKPMPASWRLVAHFAAAAWVLMSLNNLPQLDLAETSVRLRWPGYLLTSLFLVWLLNLYNFMDGIDGMAAGEAVTVGFAAALLYSFDPATQTAWVLPASLAAAALGFLLWNWPPARIFMGDAGSGFLGIAFGVLSLHSASIDSKWPWVWIILLGVFIVDASVTLLQRLRTGQRVHEAHRTHAYQNAAHFLGRHRPVTLAICAINLLWLLPIAALVAADILSGPIGVMFGYLPLVLLAIRWNAGSRLSGAPR